MCDMGHSVTDARVEHVLGRSLTYSYTCIYDSVCVFGICAYLDFYRMRHDALHLCISGPTLMQFLHPGNLRWPRWELHHLGERDKSMTVYFACMHDIPRVYDVVRYDSVTHPLVDNSTLFRI